LAPARHGQYPRRLDIRQQPIPDGSLGEPGSASQNPAAATGYCPTRPCPPPAPPVEHVFSDLKNWRILTRLRTNPAKATTLLRALLVLTRQHSSR
jgi:hypothetical protein